MSKLMYGSIDFSKLLEMAKTGHKAFSKSEKNGKLYVNINVWVNDEKDEYGNDASIQASYKDATKEDKFYFGNLKHSDYKGAVEIDEQTANELPDEDGLPF